jgi:hypothetical protein
VSHVLTLARRIGLALSLCVCILALTAWPLSYGWHAVAVYNNGAGSWPARVLQGRIRLYRTLYLYPRPQTRARCGRRET